MSESTHPHAPAEETATNGDTPDPRSMPQRKLLEETFNRVLSVQHTLAQIQATQAELLALGTLSHAAASRAEMAALDASIAASEAKVAAIGLAERLAATFANKQ